MFRPGFDTYNHFSIQQTGQAVSPNIHQSPATTWGDILVVVTLEMLKTLPACHGAVFSLRAILNVSQNAS